MQLVEHAGQRAGQAKTHNAPNTDGAVFGFVRSADHAGGGAVKNDRLPAGADSGSVSGQRPVDHDEGKGSAAAQR